MLRIDHIGLAVRDLDVARELLAAHGLAMYVEGGNGWVPVGEGEYLHVLPASPPATPRRRYIASVLDASARWSSWAVTAPAEELRPLPVGASLDDDVSERTLASLTLLYADGGLDEALSSPGRSLPYSSAYFSQGLGAKEAVDAMRVALPPGTARRLEGIAWIELAVDRARLETQIGPHHHLPIRFVEGPPGVHAVGVRVDGDVTALRFGPLPV